MIEQVELLESNVTKKILLCNDTYQLFVIPCFYEDIEKQNF